MSIDVKFLGKLQAAGWWIISADENCAKCACRRVGCGLKVTFNRNSYVPQTELANTQWQEYEVGSFDDDRKFLRARRIALGLAINEVEGSAGMSPDFLAKFEKDNPSKLPNAQTYKEWMQVLGYKLFARPAELPRITLRTIEETRVRSAARANMNEYLAKRRQAASE